MSHAVSEKTDAILALHGDAKAYPCGIAALAALIAVALLAVEAPGASASGHAH